MLLPHLPFVAVFGAFAQLAFDVSLRPALSHHLVDVVAAARVGFALQHRQVRAADDVLSLGVSHGGQFAVLGAVSQCFANLRLRPAIVDHVAAVDKESLLIGFAAEGVLIRASEDPLDVALPTVPAAISTAAAIAGTADTNR